MTDNGVNMLSTTHQALEKFDNQHDFERMSADILNALGYKNVVPVAPRGGGDGSRDVTYLNYDGDPALACVSLRKDPSTKIMSDLSARKKGDFAEYTFFTNQYLTSSEKKKITKFCLKELDAQFVPRDIEHLRSMLDTNLKSIKEDYLHINDVDISLYTITVVNAEKFSIKEVIAKAENDLRTYLDDYQRDSGGVFGLAVPVVTDIFTASTETMVSAQRKYVQKLKNLSDNIENIIGFNLKISSNIADEHIEVVVCAGDSAELVFDKQLLPSPPSRHTYDIGDIRPANVSRDYSEFTATYIADDKRIKSNLDKINGNHPKLVFNEDTYIVLPKDQKVSELEVKVFSKSLPKPQINKLTISRNDALLKEL